MVTKSRVPVHDPVSKPTTQCTHTAANLQYTHTAANLQCTHTAANLQCTHTAANLQCTHTAANLQYTHTAANFQCIHTAAAITSSVHTAAILSSAHTVQLHYLVLILYNTFSAPFNNHRVSPHLYWPTSKKVSRHLWLIIAVHMMRKTG